MEEKLLTSAIRELQRGQISTIDLDDATYYVGHETVVRQEDGKGMAAWQEGLFSMMERNAVHVGDFFSMPSDQVVEIGRQISI